MEWLFEWSSLAVMPCWARMLLLGLMAPVLALTQVFGPLGLLAWLERRTLPTRALAKMEVQS